MDSMEGDKPGVQNGDAVTQEDVNTAIDEYFTNYENISVHETMLKVRLRYTYALFYVHRTRYVPISIINAILIFNEIYEHILNSD